MSDHLIKECLESKGVRTRQKYYHLFVALFNSPYWNFFRPGHISAYLLIALNSIDQEGNLVGVPILAGIMATREAWGFQTCRTFSFLSMALTDDAHGVMQIVNLWKGPIGSQKSSNPSAILFEPECWLDIWIWSMYVHTLHEVISINHANSTDPILQTDLGWFNWLEWMKARRKYQDT